MSIQSIGHQSSDLVEREKLVLQHIIQNFVLTANPVGSRTISKHSELGLSAATIRNIMADLESQGLITHPHTSAGRIPTDRGYRYYVDSLMRVEALTNEEKEWLHQSIEAVPFTEIDEIFRESSHILGRISRQIALVVSPQLSDGILQRLELIPLSSNRVMVVLSIATGFVKTMMFEVTSAINPDYIQRLSVLLNERLAGLTLRQIRETCADRFRDAAGEESGIVRLFVEASEKLFASKLTVDKLHIDGIHEAVQQPEFSNPANLRTIIELVEDQKVIVHVLEDHEQGNSIAVTIGAENAEERMQDFSLITSRYSFGQVQGSIGVIGPKRMNYSKLVTIVDYISRLLSEKYAF